LFFAVICAAKAAAQGAFNFSDANDEELSGGNGNKVFLDSVLEGLIKQPGFSLFADYSVIAAYYPGWTYSPWNEKFSGVEVFESTQPMAAEMRATIGLDIRISPVLSFWQAVKFAVPGMTINLTEFFADYIFLNRAFIKIGKYDYRWGRSPNFDFANLLARVPESLGSSYPGELYLTRINIPVLIGGVEFIGYTRDKYIDINNPELKSFAFGGKFNLALRWIDFDLGGLFFDQMPLRTFLSFKSTIFKTTEIYGEALFSIEHDPYWRNPVFSASGGFFNDFFHEKLRINAEVFYNGESDAEFIRKDTPLEDVKKVYPFIPGINLALNIDFRPGGLHDLRLGAKFRYAVDDGSGQVIPGVIIEPARHLRIYFAMPIVVGWDSGEKYSYFKANDDKKNRPMSFVFVISLNGSYEFTRY
jgi:hypothetical protein